MGQQSSADPLAATSMLHWVVRHLSSQGILSEADWAKIVGSAIGKASTCVNATEIIAAIEAFDRELYPAVGRTRL